MKKILALLALLAGFQPAVWAQAPQSVTNAPTPHGGVLRAAGAHYLEALQQDQLLTVYLYDTNMRPVSTKKVSGSVLLEQSGQPTRLPLVAVGNDRLQAQLPTGALAGPTTVQLLRGKQAISARFEALGPTAGPTAAPAAAPGAGATYRCPMHPAETSTAPGKCARCRMNLKKRS